MIQTQPNIIDQILGRQPMQTFNPIKLRTMPKKPKTLKMTKAVRRQIYTVDIVFAVSINMAASINKLPQKTQDVLDRIQTRADNINKLLHGGPTFMLEGRDHKKYLRNLETIKKMISQSIDNGQFENDFFNAVLLLVDDTQDSVKNSKNKRLKHEWKMLGKSLFTLYGHLIEDDPEPEPERDAEWAGYKYMLLGDAMGKKIKKVVMS